jgi:hypothetical protein
MRNNVALLGTGLDFRADGGYVVGAGSVHLTGVRYKVVDPNVPPAQMPQRLVEMLRSKRQPKRKQKNGTIGEGGRNNGLHTEGSHLRQEGRSRREIATALEAINRDRCDPPLSDAEVQGIVNSVAQYAPGLTTISSHGKNHLWWFAIDVNSWCTDQRIMLLRDYQVGWLIWLRIMAWTRKGFLPNDPKMLATFAHASSHKRFLMESWTVMAFFEPIEDESQIFDPEMVAYHAEKVIQNRAKTNGGES